MDIGIGLDRGSTTTKIIARNHDGKVLAVQKFESNDAVAEAPGIVERFVSGNDIPLDSIKGIAYTGSGTKGIPETILGKKCLAAEEFYAIASGGLLLAGLEKAIVVSMGTGTAVVKAERDEAVRFGGSGVGGGTLLGLARHFYGIDDFDEVVRNAAQGDLAKIDLRIGDIFDTEYIGLATDLTCANFGKVSPDAQKPDILAGLINLILETAGVMAGMACRGAGMDAIVMTGSLTRLPQAQSKFDSFSQQTGLTYVIPPHADFATAVGAVDILWRGSRSARLASRAGK